MQIRPGQSADIDGAMRVYIEADELRCGLPMPPGRSEHLRDALQHDSIAFLVAIEGNECVGMARGAQYRIGSADGEVVPHIFSIGNIAVLPGHWGKGIGSALTRGLLDIARRDGYSSARLWTHLSNTRAQALYERIGFVRNELEGTNSVGEAIIQYQIEF